MTAAIPTHAATTSMSESWTSRSSLVLHSWATAYYKAAAGTVSLNISGWPSCGTSFKLGLRSAGVNTAQISNSPQWNGLGVQSFTFPGNPPAARDRVGVGSYSLNGRMNAGACTYYSMPMSGAFTL